MTQKRMNHLALISSHKDMADALESDQVVDEWRTGETVRENAVCSGQKWILSTLVYFLEQLKKIFIY